MKTTKIFGMLLAFALITFAASSVTYAADFGEHMRDAHQRGTTLEMHIYDNGKVLVRGAKVSSVSGATINASVAWNTTTVNWMVNTNPSTHIIQRAGKNVGIGSIAAGDVISFSGTLVSGSNGTFTMNAGTVKDWSTIIVPSAKTTVQGTVKTIPGNAAPTTFVMTVNGTDYTVKVSAGTSVLNNKWLQTGLTTIRTGDSIRVYGLFNADKTVDATVVRDISIQ